MGVRRLLTFAVAVSALDLFPVASSALIGVGFLDTPGPPRDVAVVGGLAYERGRPFQPTADHRCLEPGSTGGARFPRHTWQRK